MSEKMNELSEGEVNTLNRNQNTWRNVGYELNMTELDNLEGDGVNIQCVNSSEFVVGKQTNFNGPVTIINTASAFIEGGIPEGSMDEQGKEKIVIRGEVLSKSATLAVQETAKKNSQKNGFFKSNLMEKWRNRRIMGLMKNVFIFPVFIIVGLAISIAITLAVIYHSQTHDEEGETDGCIPLENEIKGCLYTEYAWENHNISDVIIMDTPVEYVAVSQTYGDYCFSLDSCLKIIRMLQWEITNETACNFLVGSEGNVYKLLGWNLTSTLIDPEPGKGIRLCFIGHFSKWDSPTYPQIESSKTLIKFGVENGFISKNYTLVAGDVTCGGVEASSICQIIKKWPNFKALPPLVNDTKGNDEIAANETVSEYHRIFSKEEWGGDPPTSFVKMKLPVPYVIISHSVSQQCYDLKTCSFIIKNMQDSHFSRDFADISYNFLVDSNGNIYEGRGWTKRSTALGFVNGRSIDINFIGDYSKQIKPTEKQCNGVKYLIDYGVKNGKISQTYSLVSANSTHNTLSPGRWVYNVIKNWPHFDPDPKSHIIEFE